MIPINMAFFFMNSLDGRLVVQYPSPAGAVESQLPMETWSSLVEANSPLEKMQPDVEALLVNRLGPSRGYPRHEYYLIPIDECYKLIWLIRSQWHGFSGGTEVWRQSGNVFR